MLDASAEHVGAADYFVESSVIKALGNAVAGNEQFGILDGVQIVPNVGWSIPQIEHANAIGNFSLTQKPDRLFKFFFPKIGLIKCNRSGPFKVILDTAHRVAGEGTVENNIITTGNTTTSFAAPVLLRGGKWYYEVKLRSAGAMFIGWRGISDGGNKATGDSDSSFGWNGSEAVVLYLLLFTNQNCLSSSLFVEENQ